MRSLLLLFSMTLGLDKFQQKACKTKTCTKCDNYVYFNRNSDNKSKSYQVASQVL